ncbi:MAG: redox-sensing transcriptional repressor Rex [Candidatus Omnitrophica bacterium]|nr:redox-sensing transcriptional repressor Rex [Candidatus Omnitrophota bacterium]MCM8808675.1 redox-sensing transcriptional repressor Rex [Candidatus Omnitrophota bacterium]
MLKKNIPGDTIKRLPVYLRNLLNLKKEGKKIVSSKEITFSLNISPVQFRKDLSYFGKFGKRGVGYDVDNLIKMLKKIIGIDKKIKVILVGVGRLGSALIRYKGFSSMNMEIIGAFDNDPNKIGKKIEEIEIMSMDRMPEFLKRNKIEVGIICVPFDKAQEVAEHMIKSGIKGILNFAPTRLNLSKNIFVNYVDMASELGFLIFKLKNL